MKLTLRLFPSMTLPAILIIWTLLSIAAVISCVAVNRAKTKARNKNAWLLFRSVLIITSAVCLFSLADSLAFLSIARAHGYDYDDNGKMSVARIEEGINKSPVASQLSEKEDINQKTILYYRFGCRECENVYDQLSAAVSTEPDILWIATRSKNGRFLLKKYPVNEVPSGVYIRKNGTTHTENLYDKTDKNNPLDLDALASLLAEKHNER